MWEIATKLTGGTSVHPRIEVLAPLGPRAESHRHLMELGAVSGTGFEFIHESFSKVIDPAGPGHLLFAEAGFGKARLKTESPSRPMLKDGTVTLENGSHFIEVAADRYNPGESIAKQYDNPLTQIPFGALNSVYRSICIYERWDTSLNGPFRKQQSTNLRSDYLHGDGSNLAMVLNTFVHSNKQAELEGWMRKFNPRITRIDREILGSHSRIFFTEEFLSKPVSAAGISDGSLHFLALLCVLLNPNPQGIICLEEPETGMHPDAIPLLADLLREASKRSQIIVTTHSDALIDCFSDDPEVVMVTDRDPETGETVFQRLDKPSLQGWLDNYKLGEVWRRGRIGGLKD